MKAIHTFDLLNTNGKPFVRIEKRDKNLFYVNEYPEHKSFGLHMDADKLCDYVHSKFASVWRANLIITLLIVGETFEYAGDVADCFKVVK